MNETNGTVCAHDTRGYAGHEAGRTTGGVMKKLLVLLVLVALGVAVARKLREA